jgi:hypothetical protein
MAEELSVGNSKGAGIGTETPPAAGEGRLGRLAVNDAPINIPLKNKIAAKIKRKTVRANRP